MTGGPFRLEVLCRCCFSMQTLQCRFRIERIDMTRSTIHEQMNHAFGSSRIVQWYLAGRSIASEQITECQCAQTGTATAEQLAA